MLEDLKKTHEINFNKLYEELPDEQHGIINMADYFDEDYYQNYRKKDIRYWKFCFTRL